MIFTPERTGSTTLSRLLSRHPGILCEPEPFNPGYKGPVPFLCRTLLQSQGIRAAVDSLWSFSGRNAFKHVRRADGWPFEKGSKTNDWLLLHATPSVILLNRHNGLQRAVSGQISAQIGIWVPTSEGHRQQIREHYFGPLDIPALREELAREKTEGQRTRDLLAASDRHWCEVFYEDFFAPQLALPARMEAVQKLFDFLQVPRVTDPERLRQMEWLFNPANTGFQNIAAYEKIPNIHEVEKELGSAENGYIFEPPAPWA